MGGVDMLDKQISLYRTRIRSKKWWWLLFTQILDITVVNTWRLHQIASPDEKASLLDIRRKIVMSYLSKTTPSVPKRPGPQKSKLLGGRVSLDVRFDQIGHFVVPINTQRRCALCGKKTTRICCKCDVLITRRVLRSFQYQIIYFILDLPIYMFFFLHVQPLSQKWDGVFLTRCQKIGN